VPLETYSAEHVMEQRQAILDDFRSQTKDQLTAAQ
jgi:hypothetical protein